MIELRTGLPGSGKTLSMVQKLAELHKRFDSHFDEARPVFVHGITDLALPHAPMPVKNVQVNKAGDSLSVPDWDAMPDGSLVLIDEAQSCFPPRSSASAPPDYVSWLNTHRHRGFDIWLTTQHPKLIDFSVRALVGKHVHFRRLFGGKRAITYEWDSCCDSLSAMGTAVKSYYSYPKKAFQWYKSAEIHTRQSFKVPAFVVVPIIAIIMMFYSVPRAYSLYKNGIHSEHSSPSLAASVPSLPDTGGKALRLPPGSGKDSVSRASAVVVSNVSSIRDGIDWSKVAGCMQMGDKVACFDDGGARVAMPDYLAVQALKNGWPGRPFAAPSSDVPASPATSSSSPVEKSPPLHPDDSARYVSSD